VVLVRARELRMKRGDLSHDRTSSLEVRVTYPQGLVSGSSSRLPPLRRTVRKCGEHLAIPAGIWARGSIPRVLPGGGDCGGIPREWWVCQHRRRIERPNRVVTVEPPVDR
jgi:hypothetical protein